MKITIQNLGVIKKANIDLKPFTIFVGPNNAGKTWLADTLVGILGSFGETKYTKAYIDEKVEDKYPPLNTAIQQVLDEGSATIDLVQFADEYGESYINNIAHLAPQWMQEFFNTERISFANLTVQLDLCETKGHFLEQILRLSTENRLTAFPQRTSLRAYTETGKRELSISTSTEGGLSEKLSPRIVRDFLVRVVFQALHLALCPSVQPFPTERTTFAVFSFLSSEMLTESEITGQGRRGRSMIEPVRDFLRMIANAYQSRVFMKEQEAKNSQGATYMKLAQLLEKRILGGEVDFSTSELEDQRRELLFKLRENVSLEMPMASSMVKELSSLVLYLRYLAQSGDLLVIDEPEMNLHPEAQARMTEFLAMLVNAGLQVLITTHSPYIVDHLANLMKAAESTEPEAIQDKFYLQRKEAFIPKEQVSVYQIEQGEAKNILDEDGVIHWDTFSKTSDRITEIYFEL